MHFEYLLPDYAVAVSEITADEYVIRTRPLGDGWMAINDTEQIVLGTGLSLSEAKEYCASYDKLVAEAITRL